MYVHHNVHMHISLENLLVHKQMYWTQTNFRRFQPLNVKCNIRNVYTSLHNGVCAVLVSYVCEQLKK